MDVVHTALWVSDLDATTQFYEETLGLGFSREFEGEDGVVNYFVSGESETELQFKYDPEADRDVSPSAFAHTALTVEDLEETLTAVEDSAGTVTAGPMDHEDVRIAFGEDPDGYGLEFIETA
jgi:lactoylglutathione lyase